MCLCYCKAHVNICCFCVANHCMLALHIEFYVRYGGQCTSLICIKHLHSPYANNPYSSCTKQLVFTHLVQSHSSCTNLYPLFLYQATHILTHPVPSNSYPHSSCTKQLILTHSLPTHSLTLPVPSNSYILTHPVPAYSCSLILHQTPHLSCEIWTVDSQHAKKKQKNFTICTWAKKTAVH